MDDFCNIYTILSLPNSELNEWSTKLIYLDFLDGMGSSVG